MFGVLLIYARRAAKWRIARRDHTIFILSRRFGLTRFAPRLEPLRDLLVAHHLCAFIQLVKADLDLPKLPFSDST